MGAVPKKKGKLPKDVRAWFAEQGRLGGLKGGKARLATMTTEERKEVARKAARARWDAPGARERASGPRKGRRPRKPSPAKRF